jgi:hypothetical protein
MPEVGENPRTLGQECATCARPEVFEVRSVHARWGGEDSPPEEFTYVTCRGCKSPQILLREDYGDGFDADSYATVYPPQSRTIRFYMPRLVRQAYDEAVKCEHASAWTATGAMVGRALEAVCKDYYPDARTIDSGLRRMLDAGVISQELHDWGQSLRVVRNMSAHATPEKVTKEDARYSLDFLQALLEILFDLRVRFQEWQDLRAQRAAKGKGAVVKASTVLPTADAKASAASASNEAAFPTAD